MANPVSLLNQLFGPTFHRNGPRHPHAQGGVQGQGDAALPEKVRGDQLDLRGKNFSMLELSVQFHLERAVIDKTGKAVGFEAIDFEYTLKEIRVSSEAAPEEPDALKKLLERFSPDNTAKRIADFVQRGFGRTSFGGGENTEASRKSFVDFILPFVRLGVDSALEAFGEVPDDIRKNAEDTFTRVGELLAGFVGGKQEDAT